MGSIGLYMRLSKEDNYIKDESNSITNQRLLLLNFVATNEDLKGKQILQFTDDGYSGTSMNRPRVQALLEQVRNEQIDCIIVKDFSRFSRDHIDLGGYLEQIFPFMGVRFIAVNDDYDSKYTEGGISGLADQFKMLMYDYYAKDNSQKIKSSMEIRKRQGKFVGGYAPFGYAKDPTNKSKLIVDQEAAKVVIYIFKLALKGMSMYQITKQLNAENMITPAVHMSAKYGRKDSHFDSENKQYWSVTKVARILNNEMYTGVMIAGKTKSPRVGASNSITVPKEEWIRVENTHEAIISKKDFDQEKSMHRDAVNGPRKHKRHVLCGKIVCGTCGHKMKHSNQGIPKYICAEKHVTGSDCVNHIHDSDIEAIVIQAIENAAREVVDMIEVRKATDKVVAENRKWIENQIKELDGQVQKQELLLMQKYEAYREVEISREDYVAAKGVVDGKVVELKEKIQLLEERLVMDETLVVKDITRLELMGKFVKVEKLERELVEIFVDEVVVGNGGVEVKLR